MDLPVGEAGETEDSVAYPPDSLVVRGGRGRDQQRDVGRKKRDGIQREGDRHPVEGEVGLAHVVRLEEEPLHRGSEFGLQLA